MGNEQGKKKKNVSQKKVNPNELKTYIMVVQAKLTQGRNKKVESIKKKRKEIVSCMEDNNLDIAKAKMESIFREEDYITVYDILGPLCEILKEKVTYLLLADLCPDDLRATLDTFVYASTRLEIEEMHKVRDLITMKYGEMYVTKANTNADSLVNRNVVDKMTIKPPSDQYLVARLKQLCREEKVDFDFPGDVQPITNAFEPFSNQGGNDGGNPNLNMQQQYTDINQAYGQSGYSSNQQNQYPTDFGSYNPYNQGGKPNQVPYNPPSSNFNQPSNNYNQPNSNFNQPNSNFNQPSSNYNIPSSNYNFHSSNPNQLNQIQYNHQNQDNQSKNYEFPGKQFENNTQQTSQFNNPSNFNNESNLKGENVNSGFPTMGSVMHGSGQNWNRGENINKPSLNQEVTPSIDKIDEIGSQYVASPKTSQIHESSKFSADNTPYNASMNNSVHLNERNSQSASQNNFNSQSNFNNNSNFNPYNEEFNKSNNQFPGNNNQFNNSNFNQSHHSSVSNKLYSNEQNATPKPLDDEFPRPEVSSTQRFEANVNVGEKQDDDLSFPTAHKSAMNNKFQNDSVDDLFPRPSNSMKDQFPKPKD